MFFDSAPDSTDPELVRLGEVGEVGLELDGLLEALQEHVLKLHDLLDVAEQLLRVLSRQESLFLEWLQVPLDQAVQVLWQKQRKLKPGNNYAMSHIVSKQEVLFLVENNTHETAKKPDSLDVELNFKVLTARDKNTTS